MLQGIETESTAREPWVERCQYWGSLVQSTSIKRKRREREPRPLILTGQDLSMRVDKGCLLIKDGNTHYPSQPTAHRFFKGSLDLPPRIVVVDGKGSITLDALDWLAEQNVPLVRVKYNGEFNSLITSGGQSADPAKFEWQLRARKDQKEKLGFYLPLIKDKLSNALETLEHCLPSSSALDRAIEKTTLYLRRLENDPPDTMKALLGIEAQAASVYFVAWQTLELRWKSTTQYPIPNEWREFHSRQSLISTQKGGAKIFATHPINAMLNYVYTVLLGQMQLRAISEGFDPMLGVVHTRSRSSYGPPRPGFAIDSMEPQRPVVDRVVLKFIREETFSGADFDLQSDGVVRLNPELARYLVSELRSI